MISKRVKNIKPSETLAIATKARSLKEQGKKVIDFSAGQPDFALPSFVKDAIKLATDKENIGKYTPIPGTDQTRLSICKKLKDDYQLNYAKEEVMVSVGGKHALFNIFQTLLNEGDEVILPSPYWVSFPEMIKYAGAKPIIVESDEHFQITSTQIQKKITKKTKLIVINSPSNPTGAVFDKEELEKIAELAVKHNIMILADDTYDKIIYQGNHFCIPTLNEKIKKQTIYVNSLSKTYAVQGLRLGYIAADEKIIEALTALQGQSTSNPSAIMQEVMIAAFDAPQNEVDAMVKEFKKRRDYIVNALNTIEGVECEKPAGAFYVFPKIPSKNSLQFATQLLDKKLVAVIPGKPFGRDGYIRISYACSLENIKEGVKRIKEFIESK